MTPLKLAAIGMLFIYIDAAPEAIDFIPDPVGWVMVIVAMDQLKSLGPRFGHAQAAAGLALFCSLIVFFWHPEDAVTSVVAELFVLATTTAYICLTCEAIRVLAMSVSASDTASQARSITWATFWLAIVTLGMLTLSKAGWLSGNMISAVLVLFSLFATIFVSGWFVYLLYSRADQRWLLPRDDARR